MFEVKGFPILYDEVEVLKQLRTDVELRTGRQILQKIKPSGDNIMVCCPNIEHANGQERKPSCGIAIKKIGDKPPGTVHCFACGYIDSLEGMISKCFGYYNDNSYGINWLINNFIGDAEDATRPLLCTEISRDKKPQKQIQYISEEELASYRYIHPYMYQRKLTNEIIEKYDVGYQPDFVFQKGWLPTPVITFPVRDKYGNCLFVSRRAIEGKTFFLPQDIEKPVYGIYELPRDCKEIVICESVFNALTSVAYGRPAVALLGTGNVSQYKTLNELPMRKFILALDPDKAGERGTYKLKRALIGKILTKLVIPVGKDINDLSLEEFKQLPEIFI